MSEIEPYIVGVGELLWDIRGEKRTPGGAPFNFAFHCNQLGHPAAIVSRVGTDQLGTELVRDVKKLGMSEAWIQVDPIHPTGTVDVIVDEAGQPDYSITPDVAWDYLEPLSFPQAKVVCFGTLAQRHPVARNSIRRFLEREQNALIVCDLNLREPLWAPRVIGESLRVARWLKLNADELQTVRRYLGLLPMSESAMLAELRSRYHLELICLTKGVDGAIVQTASEEVSEPGIPIQLIDTVGAGDAFTAALVCLTLEGKSLRESVRFANQLAARVASSEGGTPILNRQEWESQ